MEQRNNRPLLFLVNAGKIKVLNKKNLENGKKRRKKMCRAIKILNCNCIDEAEIEIEEGALNIKYGSNGTGKSTISKAIFAKANNDVNLLNELRPYGTNNIPDVQNLNYKKVRVFNESYVNSYLFDENSFLKNSYHVFLKSNECEKIALDITSLLQALQNIFQDSEEIKNLRVFLPKYFKAINYKDGGISKRGGVSEFLKGNGGGFDKHEELKSYRPFYSGRDMISVSKWAKWRNDGIKQMNGEICPFCTHGMDINVINTQNTILEKVFKASALSTATAVLEYIEEAVKHNYIKSDAIDVLKNYIGDDKKADDLLYELSQLALETNYLYTKIEKICLFRPMNVSYEQLNDIEKSLGDLIIEERQISKFYATDFILELVKDVHDKIKELCDNTGKLKGLFFNYQKKMNKLIEERKEDINHFFAIAGFPYKFVLKGNGEEQAVSYLVPAKLTEEDKVEHLENHLSWGEKNAFSLVMFMFEAVSDNADLIVLDDPITSFDKDKKYAVIRRMFDNQRLSFRDKTVMMLTHDIQPIIDYVQKEFFKILGLTTDVKAKYIQNEDGKLCEYEIEKTDILNIVELTKRLAEDEKQEMAIRVVNLRKYIELVEPNWSETPTYEILSNIIHGREIPVDREGENLNMNIINDGCNEIQKYIKNMDYADMINALNNQYLLDLSKASNLYIKVIAIRLLFERHEGLLIKLRQKYPATCKFVNETNHVENDYIFQLNPMKYFGIPKCYLEQLELFLKYDSGLV